MGKSQRSKRAREALKEAVYAGLRRNTGHPSHIRKKDSQSVARLWERRFSCAK